jgi:excisionase family DNA binding protein
VLTGLLFWTDKGTTMSEVLEPLTLSPSHAADYLGIGRTKMHALIRSGRIEARTLDGRIRVSAASVQAFYEAMPRYAPDALPAPLQ